MNRAARTLLADHLAKGLLCEYIYTLKVELRKGQKNLLAILANFQNALDVAGHSDADVYLIGGFGLPITAAGINASASIRAEHKYMNS